MWVPILIAAGVWVWYRRSHNLPIIPQRDPFSEGADLVQTQSGQIVAVPSNTPAVHPDIAANAGVLTPSAMTALASLKQSTVAPSDITTMAAGNFFMFGTPPQGVGGDYYVDHFGIPRSSSMARPFSQR